MSVPIFNVSNLDGSNGFRLDGEPHSYSGEKVGSLGDINGDGFDDVTVYTSGSFSADPNISGYSYVVFGQTAGFSANKDLSSLDGHDGFRVHGVANFPFSRISINNGGDINGDGIEDMIVSEYKSYTTGRVYHGYVVFGKTAGFDEDIDLTRLDGSDGFRMQDELVSYDGIERVGDINGDGFDDVIISVKKHDSDGQSTHYSAVLFGRASGFDPVVDLASLDGQNGFVLKDRVGQAYYTIHSAGDVNGDGLADVIVGDPLADLHGHNSGSTYVVFGRTSGFDAVLDLSSLDGHTGFRLDGEKAREYSSGSTSIGDINGDGFDDVIVQPDVGDYSNYFVGAYIVFGKAAGFDAQMDLSSLDGSNGFRLDDSSESFMSMNNAGDINGDGFDDFLIESTVKTKYFNYHYDSIVFGKAPGFDASINLDELDGRDGFRLIVGGEGYNYDNNDRSISRAGDVNGDGFDDLIMEGNGSAYVILGQASGFPAKLDLLGSDDSIGVRLDPAQEVSLGAFSDAGDVNGDGFDDLIVGDGSVDPNGEDSGSSYVIFGRSEFHSDTTIRGKPGDDILIGTVEKDRIEGGDGNDILDGRGGADMLLGENGDDVIKVTDLDFQLADGGRGMDTLGLSGSDLDLNLADFRYRIDEIETIDLTGSGDNTLSFSLVDFLDFYFRNFNPQTLTVEGDVGDRVEVLTGNWTDGGTDQNYRVFTHSGTTLRVDRAVKIDIVVEQGVFDLETLDGSNGFSLEGVNKSNYSVSGAGDVNGDGFDDFIVAPLRATTSGLSYVVFGKASGFDASMNLSSLDGSNGFRLDGEKQYELSVSTAGDINGDGFEDVIVGVPLSDLHGHISGSSYVIFGKSSGFDAQMDLSNLDGNNGFRLDGEPYDHSGFSVSSAGDVNGDGFDDVIVGAPSVSSNNLGTAYVVFGKSSGFDVHMDLSSLNGRNGFRLNGELELDFAGYSVSGAGDVNGDGFDDVIVSAFRADLNGEDSGSSYVVFGKASGFDAQMDLSSLDGSNGFRLDGEPYGYSGYSVSNAGDVNGDGFDDVIVGAPGASYGSGVTYVVFGKSSGFDAQMDLSSLDGSNGFRLDGTVRLGKSGTSVSGAGDVNGDGFDDVIVSEPQSGFCYVVLGKASGFDAALNLDDLDGGNGFRLDGTSRFKYSGSVSGAGDINGDGFDDLLVGTSEGFQGYGSGTSYIIFGSADLGKGDGGGGGGGELPEIKGTDGDDTLKGSDVAEHFIAGDGNDNLLGSGGADVFDAGTGDDAIRIGDLTFASVDGGDGNDELHLTGADLNLDLTTLGDRIHSIETICLYGRGDNTLTLSADSLLSLSDSTNTLKVHGNSGDHIALQDNGWVDGGSHGFYHTYTHDDAVLLVGANVTVEFM